MVVSASARNRLFNTLRERLGDADADTLMDSLPPGGWDDVATKTDLKSEVAQLRAEARTTRSELKAEIAELRAEMREGFAKTVSRDELGEVLRLHVDARVGAISRGWLFSTMARQAATIAGVIAAVRL